MVSTLKTRELVDYLEANNGAGSLWAIKKHFPGKNGTSVKVLIRRLMGSGVLSGNEDLYSLTKNYKNKIAKPRVTLDDIVAVIRSVVPEIALCHRRELVLRIKTEILHTTDEGKIYDAIWYMRMNNSLIIHKHTIIRLGGNAGAVATGN